MTTATNEMEITPTPTPTQDKAPAVAEESLGLTADAAQAMSDAIYSVHAAANAALMGAGPEEAAKETEAETAEAATPSSEALEQPEPLTEPAESTMPAATSSAALSPDLVREQLKYCQKILKGLKRHRDCAPFAVPVDPTALGILDYFTVIKHPMDLSTISKRMDLNEYADAESFISDVRLMLTNCFTYNAPDSQVCRMGRNLEKYFNLAMAKLPQDLAAAATGPAPPDPSAVLAASSPLSTRPKRESVTATGAGVGVAGGAGASAGGVRRSSASPGSASSSAAPGSGSSMTFCSTVLRELMKKGNAHLNWPFMIPVDPVALGIVDYFDIIKHPMDLSTIRKKLDTGMYGGRGELFEADVRLLFSNCYTYNPPESDVHRMGRELEAIFDARWSQPPSASTSSSAGHHKSAHKERESKDSSAGSAASSSIKSRAMSSTLAASASAASSTSSYPMGTASASQLIPGFDALEDDSEKILAINHQIQVLQAELNYLLISRKTSGSSMAGSGTSSTASMNAGSGVARARPAATKKKPTPAAHSTGSANGASGTTLAGDASATKLMTFEEKRQLSEDVGLLAADKLMRVLEIIQECMPMLRTNNDEVIELDIEALDVKTLRTLQAYVWDCLNPGKKRPASFGGNGGAKKKTKSSSGDVNMEAVSESAHQSSVPAAAYSDESSSSSSSEDEA